MTEKQHQFFMEEDSLFSAEYNEELKALVIAPKETIRVLGQIDLGLTCLSFKHYVLMQMNDLLPMINAPIDAGFTGTVKMMMSRPVTLTTNDRFFLFELAPVEQTSNYYEEFGIRTKEDAYKDDIGRDTFLDDSVKDQLHSVVQYPNKDGVIFMPRSSAARKGFEVKMTYQVTTVMNSELDLFTTTDMLNALQVVNAQVVKIMDGEMVTSTEQRDKMLKELESKVWREKWLLQMNNVIKC